MTSILVYLEDGNVDSYEVIDIRKAVEHAFRIINEGWRNESQDKHWMVYHVPEEILKVVVKVDPEQKWTEYGGRVPQEVNVELKDGTNLNFELFFEKSIRAFAHNAPKRGFGYTNTEGNIEVRPAHQIRKIYWAIEQENKDLMMTKYESK